MIIQKLSLSRLIAIAVTRWRIEKITNWPSRPPPWTPGRSSAEHPGTAGPRSACRLRLPRRRRRRPTPARRARPGRRARSLARPKLLRPCATPSSRRRRDRPARYTDPPATPPPRPRPPSHQRRNAYARQHHRPNNYSCRKSAELEGHLEGRIALGGAGSLAYASVGRVLPGQELYLTAGTVGGTWSAEGLRKALTRSTPSRPSRTGRQVHVSWRIPGEIYNQ